MKVLITGSIVGANLTDAIIIRLEAQRIWDKCNREVKLDEVDNSFRGGSRKKGGKTKYIRR